MVVTRNAAESDVVSDPRTSEVVASGKTRSALFGRKIPNKIAEKFANRVKVYRP